MKKSLLPLSLILALAFILWAGYDLCRGSNHPVPHPGLANLERIGLDEIGGKKTAAWILPSPSGKSWILAHGNSSDRNALVPRAAWLNAMGYTVVLIDLNGHGETEGKRKTFGRTEAKDIENAYKYLKTKRNQSWIGGLGTSLGGAALLKARADGVPFDALILESVFSDIRTAAANRLEMRLGKMGRLLEPLLTLQIPLWLGISRDSIRPVEWAKSDWSPTLVLAGSRDERARPSESEALYGNIPVPAKRLEVFAGAAHQDLFAFDSAGYVERVNGFLDSGLSVEQVPGGPDPDLPSSGAVRPLNGR